jgi:hypothetical protein
MARRPRWIRPDAAYSETQRTVDRQFLFRPDDAVREIIGSSVGRALKAYPVKLHWVDFNINHKQTGKAPLSDSDEHLANLVKFDRLCNSLISRGLNRLYDREGPLFSTRNRISDAIDDMALEQRLLYAVTNPVKDGLVDKVRHWKGVSSFEQPATGKVDRYTYIDYTAWHRDGGVRSKKSVSEYTRQVEVELTPLPSWERLSEHKRQAHFRRCVRQLEQEFRALREQENRTVMGPKKLSRLDPRDRPKNPPKKTGLQPICHSSTVEGANEYKEQRKVFLDQFYYASGMWLKGVYEVVFPRGSYKPPLIGINV